MHAMPHPGRRVLAALLALVIVLGSGLLWIGVPIAGFWVAGQLFTDAVDFLLFVLATVPLTMALVGFALYRVNALYVSLRDEDQPRPASRSAWLVSDTDERRSLRLRRGGPQLIDVAMAVSIVTALVLMAIWFFFLAHQNLVTPL
jgi:multisubunit Na+/H+ antiporter MnhG subunit